MSKPQEMTSPRWVELPFVLVVAVAVDGDDTDGRAGRVRDDDWLRECAVVRRGANQWATGG